MSQGSGRVLNKNIKHKCGSIVMLQGKINIASGGAVSSYDSYLDLASVTAGAGGLYTLTLNDKYAELLCCNVTLQYASAVDSVVHIRSHDVVSAKTIVLDLIKTATSTDPEAALIMHVSIFLRDTSISR